MDGKNKIYICLSNFSMHGLLCIILCMSVGLYTCLYQHIVHNKSGTCFTSIASLTMVSELFCIYKLCATGNFYSLQSIFHRPQHPS